MLRKFFGARGVALALVLGAFSAPAPAQIGDMNAAINQAGRERMLSQRMAKAYFQLGQGIETERSARILSASIALFDRQLADLKHFAPTPEIRETYRQLEKSWQAYQDILLGPAPNPAGGKRVLALSEEVLALAQQGTVQLEKLAATRAGRLVNVAGRQRMLSQRMAKLYQAKGWGVGGVEAAAELEKARREFSAALQELAAAPNNTQPIKDELELVQQQWFFFENALSAADVDQKTLAANVAKSSERILEVMENVVASYEKQPAK